MLREYDVQLVLAHVSVHSVIGGSGLIDNTLMQLVSNGRHMNAYMQAGTNDKHRKRENRREPSCFVGHPIQAINAQSNVIPCRCNWGQAQNNLRQKNKSFGMFYRTWWLNVE